MPAMALNQQQIKNHQNKKTINESSSFENKFVISVFLTFMLFGVEFMKESA